MKVLWVDDDAWAIEGLIKPISKRGIEVEITQSYCAALERLGSEDYDAFIIDIILPYGSSDPPHSISPDYLGLELIKRIRALNPQTPIIALSVVAHTISDSLSELEVKTISKPALPSSLRDVLIELIDEHK